MSGAEREGDPTRDRLMLLAQEELTQIRADLYRIRYAMNAPVERRLIIDRMVGTLTRLRAWSDLLAGEGR